MTVLPGEFDESHDTPQRRLPLEDRLWRHPSELDPLALHPDAKRRLRLLNHPSRRSALTAAIVGALIASGVAALVTHLADSMSGTDGRTNPTTTSLVRPAVTPLSISKALASKVNLVAAAMVTVQATHAKVTSLLNGLVIRSDGMLLVPAAAVAGAQAIEVTLADGDVYVGQVVGIDHRSGLAVLRINGASGLQTVSFSTAPIENGSFGLAVILPGRKSYALGTVDTASAARTVDGHTVIGSLSSDISPEAARPGSPLLSAAGTVEGVVIGFDGGTAVVSPSWIAWAVARDETALAHVSRGWLGIRCVTNTGHPAGARIVWMSPHSSLVKAGLRVGWVIVAVDRVGVGSVTALEARLYGQPPGSRVSLTVADHGSLLTRVIRLARSPNG